MKKIYISPSNQYANIYAWGGTDEHEQCQMIAEAAHAACERCGIESVIAEYQDSLTTRCIKSNDFGADIHLCIHTNAYNAEVMGTRIFSYDTKGEGYKAANCVFNVLAPLSPGKSENVKSYPALYEIRTPTAPSVYCECEFHDTVDGAKWIVNNTTEIGEAIIKGLCDYLGVTYKAPETPNTLYRVQVGAFKNKGNAEFFQSELKAKGFDAFVVEVK